MAVVLGLVLGSMPQRQSFMFLKGIEIYAWRASGLVLVCGLTFWIQLCGHSRLLLKESQPSRHKMLNGLDRFIVAIMTVLVLCRAQPSAL